MSEAKISKALAALVDAIKTDREYKTQVKDFKEWVTTKDKTRDWLKYFLVYDIDQRKFKNRSAYNITQNHIVLWDGYLPPLDKKENPIDFKEYTYKVKDNE
jgi:hypothetical protein